MKQIFTFYLVLLFSIPALCQNKNIDSLIYVLETTNMSLDEKLEGYSEISNYYTSNDLEKSLEYASKGLQLSQRAKNREKEFAFLRIMGIIYFNKASYDTAHIYNNKALALALDMGDKQLESKIYVGFGNVFFRQQNYQAAIEYYLKGLALEDGQPTQTTAAILTNLGAAHRTLKNPDRAIYYFQQALDIARQLNLAGIKEVVYHGLGVTYLEKKSRIKQLTICRVL
ncbi:MAG: tetratricopeptide repeat protein [Tannerellaceae bacterium]|nr:tetratricopeptide repeat protein [Tannerellaceae bacterium]